MDRLGRLRTQLAWVNEDLDRLGRESNLITDREIALGQYVETLKYCIRQAVADIECRQPNAGP